MLTQHRPTPRPPPLAHAQAYLYFQYRRWYILSFFLSLALLAVVSKVFYIVRTRRRVGPEPTRVEWAMKETCIHMPFSFYVRALLALFAPSWCDVSADAPHWPVPPARSTPGASS